MLLTRRFLILLALIAIPTALSGYWAALGRFSLASNLVLFAALVLDWMLTPGASKLSVEREFEDKLSLDAKNTIKLIIRNQSQFQLNGSLRDEPPISFDTFESELPIQLEPNFRTALSYAVVPRIRGVHSFGNVNLRYLSRLKLFKRQIRFALPASVKVYPNLIEVKKYAILAKRGRWAESGMKPSVVYGEGTEFESLRNYIHGDDFRRINWKATARVGNPICEQYQPERSQNIMVMLDSGRMMTSAVGSGSLSRLDHAINAALMLGYVGCMKGDKIGLTIFSNQIEAFIPPHQGKSQIYEMLEALYNTKAKMVQPDYERALQYVELKNRKRSLIVLFSDLTDPETSKALVTYLPRLTPRHLTLCVSLNDSEMLDLADMLPSDLNDVYKKASASQLLSERENALAELQKKGVLILDVPPEQLSVTVVNKYLQLKAKSML
jgi:uncharacterized protein (DUF58 family)